MREKTMAQTLKKAFDIALIAGAALVIGGFALSAIAEEGSAADVHSSAVSSWSEVLTSAE